MAAAGGQTQSLHTNSFDEALALPTDFSARISRNTQIFLQQEAGACRTIDMWGGSYYVERLTYDLARKAWAHIQEVEGMGGMAKAIEEGLPKLRIEEAAAKTQARIDSGVQTIVGVNKFRLNEAEDVPVLRVDNAKVRQLQLDKLARLRSDRDETAVTADARRHHESHRDRHGQPARTRRRRRSRQGHRGRNQLRHRESCRAPSGRDQIDSGRVC